ncbi:hypothetical protein JWG45_17760, partial [Leptospira sp. 201903070]
EKNPFMDRGKLEIEGPTGKRILPFFPLLPRSECFPWMKNEENSLSKRGPTLQHGSLKKDQV